MSIVTGMRRRTVLALGAGLVSGVASLAGCGRRPTADGPAPGGARRVRYGEDPSQFADLHLPAGTPRGVVVVVHGGFWSAGYDLSLGTPLAQALAAQGWIAWNLEYRRVGRGGGGGGGVPTTLDDVAAGIDALADVDPGLDLSTVLGLGHSAGGHLAVWAAGRDRTSRWAPARVPLTGVVSQAGVLDLRAGAAAGLGGGAVQSFTGTSQPGADVDPVQQLPLHVPVRCVHARGDGNVPFEQSASYVAAARSAGGDAELVEVAGDHFTVIDPTSAAWTTQLELLDALAG